jgi:hypothetical protein
VEELVADWREQSVRELHSLHDDVQALIAGAGRPALAAAVEERFARACFPFRHDRVIPRITVVGSPNGLNLDPGFRNPKPWTAETKRELIALGRRSADEALRAHGLD